MPRRRPRQLQLPVPPTSGGRRRGAGRKPSSARSGKAHARRPDQDPRHPVHVTLRGVPALASFRAEKIFSQLQDALAAPSHDSFRVIQFSVQSDHLHLIVEAEGGPDLAQGVQRLAVRCARAVNRALGRRGTVWGQRYHCHALRTPREVRLALAYVLLNFRKHLRAAPGVDPRSSGPWFDGWAQPATPPATPCPVRRPRTWLASIGWRRSGGPVDCRETPALRGGR